MTARWIAGGALALALVLGVAAYSVPLPGPPRGEICRVHASRDRHAMRALVSDLRFAGLTAAKRVREWRSTFPQREDCVVSRFARQRELGRLCAVDPETLTGGESELLRLKLLTVFAQSNLACFEEQNAVRRPR